MELLEKKYLDCQLKPERKDFPGSVRFYCQKSWIFKWRLISGFLMYSLLVALPPSIVDLGFDPGRAPPLGNVEVALHEK